MKKKILLLLTVICLVFTTVMQPLSIAAAETTTSTAMNIGDVISGFRLTQTGYDSSTKSKEYYFVHEKTNAKLLVMKNNDKNRGFSIKFNTPADNDKGINHIIEHSVLGGSKKYPSNNIIFDVSNATYTSFANAFTSVNMTCFPICSASEEQLMKNADIYLDGVFNPLFLTDEKIFEREGWRYELKSEDTKLARNGIVYNEMKGNMGNISTASLYYAEKAIFPNSNQGNISGGDPNEISKLTYKEFVDTYKKNYHPSNSFMVLYGDVDYEAFLKMIDENYLSSYTKQTYKVDRNTQKPFKKLVEKTFEFPASKASVGVNRSVIDLVFATNDIKKLGFDNYVGLDMLVSQLNANDSDLQKLLQQSKIGSSYKIQMGMDTYQPTVHFIANNADPKKKKDFYKLVMKELKDLVDAGLYTDVIKASLRSSEFEKALGNDSNTASTTLLTTSMFENLTGDPFANYNDSKKKIISQLDDKILEKILKENILDSKIVALTVTTPKAGLLEKNDKAKEKELTKVKSTMSKDEKSALVNKTKEFTAWINEKTPDKIINSLRAVSLKDLTTEVRDRNIKETTVDGAKLITADADVESIGSAYMNFDLSHLSAEELHYLKFYSDMMMSGMATDKRAENDVLKDVNQKAYNIIMAVDVMQDDQKDTTAHPIFSISYYGFNDEYADTFDLVSDMLLNSKASDISTYGTRAIANEKNQYQSLIANPLTLVMVRSLAYTSPTYQYVNYIIGSDYYNFVLSLEKQIETDPTKVIEKIKEVRAKAFNKNNLVIMFAGDLSAQEKYKESLNLFTQKLPDKTYPKAVYTLPKPAKREAFTIDSSVQYLCVNSSLTANNVPIDGKCDVVASVLNNLYLTPEVRLKGGAYGVSASFMENNYYVFTYRDANYANSLSTIGKTDEFLKTITSSVTEDTLENYKLSAYAASTQSRGEIGDAIVALINNYQGFTWKDKINYLKDIKEITLKDVQDYAANLDKINNNLNYVVIASPSSIEEHKDLFDVITPLK